MGEPDPGQTALFPPFPMTDPADLFRRRDGLYASDLLITAIGWLDFFNWLLDHPSDRDGICDALQVAARPADVMISLFTAMGLVTVESNVVALTALAREYLVKDSPWDLGPYFGSLAQRPICRDILDVLRTGGPFGWANQQAESEWALAMERADFARDFTAAMDSRGAYLAPSLAQALDCAGYTALLDIAGGSGIYACAVVSAHAHMRAAVLEKPPVDILAAEAIAGRDLDARVGVMANDMFVDPLPLGFDIHLYSHVLHDWDEVAVQSLLCSSYASLPPGGLVAVHDAHLAPGKAGPLPVAEYSVLLMLSTQGKCYSVDEMFRMLESAGFESPHFAPTNAHRSLITARKEA